MYHETKRLIKKAMFENKLVVFVGAGASVNSGIPLWRNAIEQIKKNLEPEYLEDNDYLKIPQFYFNSRGFKEYNELIKKIFSYEGKLPNNLHRKIFQFIPGNIITTNYDDFLEKVSDENGEFLEVIERDADIPYAKNDRLLIKMHGGFKYDNYVLKEDDYLNYHDNFRLTETLIKALIARNTVLFIGYSFNDPDTKQIFNWIKNALENNYQRAYMIIADQTYNQILYEYYKNIGINLIFANKCLDDEDYGDDITQNTINCLDYFLKEEIRTDIADSIYDKLVQCESLNYILSNYIGRVLSNYGGRIDGKTIKIRGGKLLEFFQQMSTFTLEPTSEDKIMHKLSNLFSKADLCYVQDLNNELSDKIKISEEILHNTDFFDAIINGDYEFLKKFADSVNIYDENISLSERFKVPFALYKIHDYQKAIKSLRELSKICKRDKNYVWHFITEYNIKKLIRYSNSALEGIKDNNINLQEILYKYNLQTDDNNFLVCMANNNLFFSAFYDSIDLSKEVESDKNPDRISSEIGIYKFENCVINLYKFINYNFIMVEKYDEIRQIFQNFVRSSISSHSFVPFECDTLLFGLNEGYSLPEISVPMVLFSISCFSLKELEDLFIEYNLKRVKLSKEAQEFLLLRAENYYKSQESHIINSNEQDLINNIILFSSKTILDKDIFNKILLQFNQILDRNYYYSASFFTFLSNFIANHWTENREIIQKESLIELIYILINVMQSQDKKANYYYNRSIQLLRNCCTIIHEMDKEFTVDDKKVSWILDVASILEIVAFYQLSGELKKHDIKVRVSDILKNSQEVNYELYWHALINKIIDPMLEVEDKLIDSVDKLKNMPTVDKIHPNPYKDKLSGIIYLKLNGYILQADKFDKFYVSDNGENGFLFNMNDFDYSNFELSWLPKYNVNLLKIISNHAIAKNGITKKFIQEQRKRGLQKQEIELYFDYFA